jgi:hypothetical protein
MTRLTLAFNNRTEVEKGVWEDNLILKDVKAIQTKIFQSRQDQAKLNSLIINGRFEVRGNYTNMNLEYVTWKHQNYKIHNIVFDINDQKTIIEIGALT